MSLISILDFLVLTTMWWVMLALLVVIIYAVSSEHAKLNQYPLGAEIFLTLITAGLIYRYPVLQPYARNWVWWVAGLGAYLGAGFLICSYKWLAAVLDFRKRCDSLTDMVLQAKTMCARRDHNQVVREGTGETEYVSQRLKDLLGSDHGYGKVKIDVTPAGVYRAYLDWNAYPLAIWWVYWPFFLFSCIFDPIQRAVRRFIDWMKRYFHAIALRFSVSA